MTICKIHNCEYITDQCPLCEFNSNKQMSLEDIKWANANNYVGSLDSKVYYVHQTNEEVVAINNKLYNRITLSPMVFPYGTLAANLYVKDYNKETVDLFKYGDDLYMLNSAGERVVLK